MRKEKDGRIPWCERTAASPNGSVHASHRGT
jgi:hypothetical protein